MPADPAQLERNLGYRYRDRGLLEQALSHRSCGPHNNERLEFLGDSILNHVVAEELFRRFANSGEGELSRMRAVLVQRKTLAEAARALDIGPYIRFGAKAVGSEYRLDSVLCDVLEALVGALLLDADMDACRDRVSAWLAAPLEDLSSPSIILKDAKTRLQEYLQSRGWRLPEYRLLREQGEGHKLRFTVACEVEQLESSPTGAGSGIRKAEQAAAAAALELLGEDPGEHSGEGASGDSGEN